jgi:hypothetical protein
MRWLVLACVFAFLGFCGKHVVADECYELLYNGSCQGWLGDRIPDFGCVGCTVQNGQSHCVGHQNALRSLAEPAWSEDTGVRVGSGATGYHVAQGYRVCAAWFDCYPLCYFDEKLGRDNCFIQNYFGNHSFLFDYVTSVCAFT